MSRQSLPDHFHIKAGYVFRPVPTYYGDDDPNTVWQPDVYRLLRDLAVSQDCRQIIDLGCGRAGKLVTLHPEFSIVGVDIGSNLQHCQSAYPWGQWIEADLEHPCLPLPIAGGQLPRAIVCADVIEHLVDPTGLLHTLSSLLAASSFALLSTPERDLTRGVDHLGPSPNHAHVREWNLREFQTLLEASGMTVALAGVTASNDRLFKPRTALALVVRNDCPLPQRHALAARCQALLRTYAAERHWRDTGEAVDGRASWAETTVHATALPTMRGAASTMPRGSLAAPLVSIIAHVAAGRHCPASIVDSVLSQTWMDWELLIPEDVPPAVDLETVMAAAPDRVRRFRPPSTDRAAIANAGVAAARGRYVAVLDEGVTWDPLFLAAGVAHLDARRGASVGGAVTFHWRPDASRATGTSVGDGRAVTVFDEPSLTLGTIALGLPTPASTILCVREALNLCGGYREDLDGRADNELVARFISNFDLDVLPLVLASVEASDVGAPSASASAVPPPPAFEQARMRARQINAEMRRELSSRSGDLAALLAWTVGRVHDLQRRRAETVAGRERELVRVLAAQLEAQAVAGRERDKALAQAAQLQAQAVAQRDALYTHLLDLVVVRLRRGRARSVVIVGTGELGGLACRVLRDAGIQIVAVADNDATRWHQDWHGLSVSPVEDAAAVEADAVIIASVAHAAALARQVRRLQRARHVRRRIVTLLGTR